MATQTKTLNPHALRVERTYDFLYDPIYAVSGQRDHSRVTVKAQTDSSKLKLLPIYRTMFSDLRHCPRYQLQYDPSDPVPKSVPRQWRGFVEQARDELIQQRSAVQASSGLQLMSQRYGDQEVSGKNRVKFFRRPIIPFLQQVPPDVVLDTSNIDPLAAAGMIAGGSGSGRQMVGYGPGGGMERPMTPLVRTMFTQTDYRDSEAQTDPYTPEYVIRPGSAPELLTLATLSHGHGLPAGLAEVEMIERARAKRAWEAQLPPLNDMSQSDKRRRMMEDMERTEWALREREIEKLQEARLEVLKRLLVEREERHQEMNSNRLDQLWSRKQEDKAGKLKNIRHEHLRLIRKLTKKCQNVEGKYERRDIINDFTNFESQSYAPLTRVGVFIDKGSEQFVVKSRLLNTYEGLLELENTMPMYVMNPHIRAPHPRNVSQGGHVLRKYRKEKELAEVHQVIKDRRVKTVEPEKPLRFLKKIERPAPRPPTPSVEVPSEVEEERELATIFLQKLIRGRAVQNMMFEGKEKRIELIGEMRSTHALQEAQQQVKKEEKQMTLALQRQRRIFEHKESFVDEVLAEMEGTSAGDMLDFLSKELIRLQEERRIHAFCMLAERDRRLREAAEAGRRQLEERRRREEDEIFKQVISVHQRTVDSYLEDIILNGTDATADKQAREEIQEMAKRINDVAYDIEENRSQLQSEEIVAELVHGFLLPEVQKETVRERVQRYQRHHLLAAHKEIHKTGEDIITTVTPRKRTLPPTPRAVMVDFPLAPEPIIAEQAPSGDGEEKRDEDERTLTWDELEQEAKHEEREEAGEMDTQPDADWQDNEPSSLSSPGDENAEKRHPQPPTETFPLDVDKSDVKVIKSKMSIDAIKEESFENVDETQHQGKMEAVAEEEEEEAAEQPQEEEVQNLRDLEQEEEMQDEEQPKEEEAVVEYVAEHEQPESEQLEQESELQRDESEDSA